MRDLIAEALLLPRDAVYYGLSRAIAQRLEGDQYLLETEDWSFDLEAYAAGGEGEIIHRDSGIHSEYETHYDPEEKRVYVEHYNAHVRLKSGGLEFECVTIGLQGSYCRNRRHFLIGHGRTAVEELFMQVVQWNREVRGEVLVYDDGWHKDKHLLQAIQGSTLDNLILEDNLKEAIRDDFERFFAIRDVYERHGIPWKRGVLLLGPPGNGKTHMIKALINHLRLPAIYVRTFARDHGTEDSSIREVFARARNMAPCLLILEDLDAILNDANRSYFLNEMDGFASNAGVMTIGTTNHPERLDPAILERPSRFDRKYTFSLPGPVGRREYLLRFGRTLDERMQLDGEALDALAEATDGFSYAYLKELYLSAMMVWVVEEGAVPMETALAGQIETLLGQMRTEGTIDGAAEPPPAQRSMERWRKLYARRFGRS
jgi:hypothetical protein